MSDIESWFCRTPAWALVARRAALPWALNGRRLGGETLEVGGGSAATGAAILVEHPHVRLTVTDTDPTMVAAAARRLASFGARATVRQADATRLPFADCEFDTVVSFLMLHHTLYWREALAEAARVTRPGGLLVGYDLTDSTPARLLHRLDRSPFRLITQRELNEALAALAFVNVAVEPGWSGLLVRFAARRDRSGRQEQADLR